MRHPLLLSVLLAAGVTAGLTHDTFGLLRSSAPPDDRCAAPPTFQACNECHSGADINSGAGAFTVFTPSVYTPGQTYTLLIELQDPSAARWGFEITALDQNLNGAGTFTPINSEVQVSNSGGVEYAKHTSVGTSPGQTTEKSWQFEWTAPATDVGPVRFYAAGNAANANSSSSGDKIYTTAVAVASKPQEDATITLQPESAVAQRGSNWRVMASVRDHTGSNNQVLLVSRVKLPNGKFFPNSGWLFPPQTVNMTPGNWMEIDLDHVIPPSAPQITATYQAIIGRSPNTVVDINEFQFTIQ